MDIAGNPKRSIDAKQVLHEGTYLYLAPAAQLENVNYDI